ncbi:MAG: tetratricopeptide repeat protein [Gemmatimonadetes bacterium]|nr:tetratricopeptide repeat protein [Gemmatimonadota bacterium]
MSRRLGALSALLVPSLVLGAGLGGCATRGDVHRLEDAVLLMRAESARRDSSATAEVRALVALTQRTGDSVEAIRAQIAQIKGDLSGELYAIAQQLVQVQELTGQSQQRLTELRTQLEARGEQIAEPASGTPGATAAIPPAAGGAAAPAAGGDSAGGPTADQIYQASLQQLRRGSVNTARTGFRELLRRYPQSARAADGLYFIGESFAAESPDSAQRYYQQVVDKYASSPRAATALYKMGLQAEQRRDPAGARTYYGRVVQSYPNSDEAALARDRLRSLGR